MIQLVHYVAFVVNFFDSDRLVLQVISDSFDTITNLFSKVMLITC